MRTHDRASLLAGALLLLFLSEIAAADPWARHAIDNSSRGADGVRLADVNADNLLDVATGWEEGGLIRVYLNPGPQAVKQPWPAVTVGNVKSPEDAVLVDLDNDGAMDVVSSCEGKNRTVYVHWAPADPARYLDGDAWQTAPIPCTARRQMWMFALPMQVDARHGIDLVLGSKGSGASIGWLRSPKDPRETAMWTFQPLYEAGWIMSLRESDLDGDGDLDILASDRKGSQRGIVWLEHPGQREAGAGASWPLHRLDQGDREVMFLTLSDFGQSGTSDIFCAVRGRGISHLHCPGAVHRPWKHQEIALPAGCGTGKAVEVGDIDCDGENDLVFSCENARGDLSGIRWLSRSANRTDRWVDHEISGPRGTKYDRLELLDLDADGDLDVMTCEESVNLGVVWYENPSR